MDAEVYRDPESMDASTLFRMAKQQEANEARRKDEQRKEDIRRLREERKRILKRQQSECAALDREITKLERQRNRLLYPARTVRHHRIRGMSRKVVDLLQEQGQLSTDELRSQLQALDLNTKNLGQTLNYLKRTGRIALVRRGVYAPV